MVTLYKMSGGDGRFFSLTDGPELNQLVLSDLDCVKLFITNEVLVIIFKQSCFQFHFKLFLKAEKNQLQPNALSPLLNKTSLKALLTFPLYNYLSKFLGSWMFSFLLLYPQNPFYRK
jgi:hypothetical protein